ncbi:MAG: hypothetical protein IT319_22565 [Anaerolineae bacterium]|nr:hypothetical protein [Anaerolineae bacterium]
MYATVFDNIIFIEGTYQASKTVQNVETSIKGFSAQLQSLRDVKMRLAITAKQFGANAIIEFEYGQKSPTFWGSFGDNVNWYGRGIAVLLSRQQYQEIIDSLDNG